MKTKISKITIEVREHPISTPDNPRWYAVVTTARGRCYFVSWAGDKPTEEMIQQAWSENRSSFDPYYS